MKALKRPMFRMGGPIKEGIMDGMKEPQAINTVGSPLAPKDETGRGGYAFPLLAGAGMAALRFLPAAYRGFKAARAYTPLSQNLGVRGRLKDIFMPKAGLGAPMAPAGAKQGFRVGSFLRSNPLTSLPIAGMAIEGGARGVAGLAKMTPDLLKSYANAVIPFADPFKTGKPEVEKTDDTGLEVVDKFCENQKGGEVVSQEVKDNITKDRIEENRKRYYKLMGIDKMKKDATYDSLIDASRIIQEQGGDLKGAVKSGTLQNAIIQAISKNLDKSADLKKQIDAAILKGEIEKDIKSADTLERDYKRAKVKALERAEETASAKGRINEIFATEGTIPGTTTAALLDNDGIKFDAIIPDKELTKYQKDNPNKTEVDFFKSIGGSLEDGRYVVGRKLIEKRGGQIKIII